MPEQRIKDVLKKHNLDVDDVRDRKTTLHHLRHIVRTENLPFDVFQTLVRLRR
ncbi:MAG TPA: hypothetical protein VMT00_06515 [Thermoanaerobaculia bacterium]|nr:hypothetical protein [Thermoanaerobaculia bacterium]